MRELVGGKNTIGRMAAELKKPHKATFTFTFKFNKHTELCGYSKLSLSSELLAGKLIVTWLKQHL